MLVSTKYHWNISFQKKLPSKYVVKNAIIYYETIVQLLYLSGNYLPLVMIYKNELVTLKNLILKYIHDIGMTNINILKRKCHVGINVVFLEVILKLCDVCFMKNICIAPWTCLHHFDLHIIIRWPENVKICIHCGHFIHCYILWWILYYFLAVHDSLWLLVTLILTTEHENKLS